MNRRTAIIVLSGFLFALPAVEHLSAQQAPFDVHFSYEAENLAPADYRIRALPPITPGTRVRISASLLEISDAGGTTFLNPASYDYQWYHNERFVAGGKGTAAVTISVGRRATTAQTILLRIFDARGRFIQDARIALPLGQPTVALLRQSDGATALAETPLVAQPNTAVVLVAKPYFFSAPNLERLTFDWTYANNPITGPTEEPRVLRITIPELPEERPADFILTVANTDNRNELVRRNFTVTVQ